MKLVIGGVAQGKREYAKETFGIQEGEIIDGEQCFLSQVPKARAVDHFQVFLRTYLNEKEDRANWMEQLIKNNPEIVIICTEVGSGIVPLEAEERLFREEVGRSLCQLAKEAKQVHRVLAGIGMVIKSE